MNSWCFLPFHEASYNVLRISSLLTSYWRFPGKHPCMLCKSTEGDIVRCNIPSCGKFFHRSCLKNGLWPQARFSETQLTCPGAKSIKRSLTRTWAVMKSKYNVTVFFIMKIRTSLVKRSTSWVFFRLPGHVIKCPWISLEMKYDLPIPIKFILSVDSNLAH